MKDRFSLRTIDTSKGVVLDIETTGLDRHRDSITSLQLGWFDIDNGNFKMKFFDWSKLTKDKITKLMKFLCNCKLVTHNGKFDFLFLFQKTGIELPIWHDTIVMAHVTGHEELGLKALTELYFGVSYDIEKEAKTGKITQELIDYGLNDIKYTLELYRILRKQLKEKDVEYVYAHELRVYKAYYKVEQTGVPISPRRHDIKAQLQEEYEPILARLKEVADINWNSNDQVGAILFSPEGAEVRTNPKKKNYWLIRDLPDNAFPSIYAVNGYVGELVGSMGVKPREFKTKKEATEFLKYFNIPVKSVSIIKNEGLTSKLLGYGLGLECKQYTAKGKPAVGVEVLSEYISHPVIADLLQYKKLTKLETFINSWEDLQVEGRIYPSFNITARTGRTTCHNPNLQQVPQKSMVRGLIEAQEGYTIISCDYSQAELRVASWFSGDENMQGAYNSGSDLHQSTKELIYGDKLIDPEVDHDGAKRQRTISKATNFGLVYGAMPQTLVNYIKNWGIDMELSEAKSLHKAFFEAYPKLLDFYKRCKNFTVRNGYIESPIGRKRWLPDIYSNNWKLKSGAERQCVNTPVQGMASDICISALADIVFDETLDHSKFNVLGSVHDAILIECKEEYAEELGEKVVAIMSNPSVLTNAGLTMPIPLKADLVINKTWGD